MIKLIEHVKNLIKEIIKLGSSKQYINVVPNDTKDLESYKRVRALYIGVEGDVAVEDYLGTQTVFKGVSAGTTLAIAPKKVLATDTTATDIIALV